MKTLSGELLKLLNDLEILEPETIMIAEENVLMDPSMLLQIDSTIKLSRIKDNTAGINENLIDVESAVQNIGR